MLFTPDSKISFDSWLKQILNNSNFVEKDCKFLKKFSQQTKSFFSARVVQENSHPRVLFVLRSFLKFLDERTLVAFYTWFKNHFWLLIKKNFGHKLNNRWSLFKVVWPKKIILYIVKQVSKLLTHFYATSSKKKGHFIQNFTSKMKKEKILKTQSKQEVAFVQSSLTSKNYFLHREANFKTFD